MSELSLDRAGRPPRNMGLRYPADPPKVEEIVAVLRTAGDGVHRRRLRGLIVILWEELHPWLELRVELPVGPLLCVINGPTRGRHWSSAAARTDLRWPAKACR